LDIGGSLNEDYNEEITIMVLYANSIKPRCVCNTVPSREHSRYKY